MSAADPSDPASTGRAARGGGAPSHGHAHARGPGRGLVLWLVGLAGLHLALWLHGLTDPDAWLRFDRAAPRIDDARALLGAAGAAGPASGAPPLDYAWHALLLAVWGGWAPGVVLAQLALAVGAGLAIHRMARLLGESERVGWLAALLHASIPIDFAIPHFAAAEAIANPLLVFGALFLVRYGVTGGRGVDLAASGALLGLAVATRPELAAWLPPLVVLLGLVAHRVAPSRGAAHLALFVALLASAPLLSSALRAPAPAEGPPLVSAEYELVKRARAVSRAAGQPVTTAELAERPVAGYLAQALEHPAVFLREWGLHAAKLVALPDNLDTFRLLGLYEYTGRRADLVHDRGLLGAARVLTAEMPVLFGWLLGSIALFAVFWLLALRGGVELARGRRGVEGLLWLALVSLPAVTVLTRALTQGESRKRAPVDFVLALLAAVGWTAWRSARRAGGATDRVSAGG